MKLKLFFFFLVVFCARLEAMEGIDKIYLINLERRSDRLASVQNNLAQYGIYADRFPAIDGRELSLETLIDLALPYTSEVSQNRWVTTPIKDGALGYAFLNRIESSKPVFSEWMSIGAVGCAMSHLSILRDAYENGYKTIWVMEDDICIEKDPRVLSDLIKKLDVIANQEWDLLYTDSDEDISSPCWWMWRPDRACIEDELFSYRKKIDADFVKIGSRPRTHSMIIRRSGIKKLLEYFENNHLFLPIDHEIAFAAEISLYMLSYPIVTYDPLGDTDIQIPQPFISYGSSDWDVYKKSIFEKSIFFPGWCDPEKAGCLMDFIYDHRPNLCVEIGAFGGSTSYPIASALRFLNRGHLYAIDAWRKEEALQSFFYESDSLNYSWWAAIDFDELKKNFENQLTNQGLMPWCTLIKSSSTEAVDEFRNGAIDLLYVDGNSSEKGSLDDLMAYFPKVKPGGYIWLNDANHPFKRASMAYLTDKATFMPQKSLRNSCVVFQKPFLD